MSVLYIPIGIPGAGKSTLCRAMVEYGYFRSGCVISPDKIRADFIGETYRPELNPEVFDVAYSMLNLLDVSGNDGFWDATNCNTQQVVNLLETVENMECVLIDMNVQYDVAVQRNAMRANPVPEGVLKNMERGRVHVLSYLARSGGLHQYEIVNADTIYQEMGANN